MVGELQAGDPRGAGPYRLVGRLGAGGMGQVFLGRSATGALAAVKVIRPELADEPGFRERFAREVAAAANVSGRFTALVLDADVQSATPWLATAYVAGPSLAQAVTADGPLPVPAVLSLAAGLAQGLGAIHAAGLVHRDLKPANVLLAADGPRVIDFGISRSREASMLTAAGMVVGSPGFMSPEQAIGRWVGPSSDVFSLGAVLAFAATATHPFGTGTPPMLMYRVVHHEADLSAVPEQLRPLVGWCLAKEPGYRPGTGELLARLGVAPRAAASARRHRAPAHAPALTPSPALTAAPALTPSPALTPTCSPAAGLGPEPDPAPVLTATPAPAAASALAAAPAGARAGGAALAQRPAAPQRPARAERQPSARRPAAASAGQLVAAGAAAAGAAASAATPGRPGPGRGASAELAPTILVPASRPGGRRPARPGQRSARVRISRRGIRRRLAWAGALAGFMAAVTATVVLLPGVLRGPPGARPRSEFQAGAAPARPATTALPATGATLRPAAPAPGAPSLAAGLPARPASPSPPASAAPSPPAASVAPSPPAVGPAPLLPQVLTATTYSVGRLVYLSLTYADPGGDAAGFGFAGVNGAKWAAESHPFTGLTDGLVSVGTVAYPFDLGCGTAQQYQGSVAAWIYDAAGRRGPSVTARLACGV
jgi:hypothetical protein